MNRYIINNQYVTLTRQKALGKAITYSPLNWHTDWPIGTRSFKRCIDDSPSLHLLNDRV